MDKLKSNLKIDIGGIIASTIVLLVCIAMVIAVSLSGRPFWDIMLIDIPYCALLVVAIFFLDVIITSVFKDTKKAMEQSQAQNIDAINEYIKTIDSKNQEIKALKEKLGKNGNTRNRSNKNKTIR